MRNLLILCGLLLFSVASTAQPQIKTLIVNGQSFYHDNWPEVTEKLKTILENSGRFSVDVLTSKPLGEDISDFRPQFEDYQVIVSLYDGTEWPEQTKAAFEKYMANGGGFVSIHAADNAFPEWEAYNLMIGLGGWGKRNEKSGPYVYYSDLGQKVIDHSQGPGGAHGKRHAYLIESRKPEHPIMQGIPEKWLHANDELYERLRGPAKHMEILATAYAEPQTGGSGRHEPILMTIQYDKGRIFHSVMAHDTNAADCVGFITTFLRGTEWAATGKVTIPVPKDFPTETKTTKRSYAN